MNPSARSRHCRRNAVLPIPGSPSITMTCGRAARAAASPSVTRASSACRPTNTPGPELTAPIDLTGAAYRLCHEVQPTAILSAVVPLRPQDPARIERPRQATVRRCHGAGRCGRASYAPDSCKWATPPESIGSSGGEWRTDRFLDTRHRHWRGSGARCPRATLVNNRDRAIHYLGHEGARRRRSWIGGLQPPA
jgi:hypothetical protein